MTSEQPDAAVAQRRILVADDQPTQLLLVKRTLNRAGYENVETVREPAEIPALCELLRPDLLLLDLHMPELDGFEVLTLLGPYIVANRLPVLVLTRDISVQSRRRALALGARDFLTKPPDSVELLARVRNLLETRGLELELERQNGTLRERVLARTAALERARRELLDRMALVAEMRDYATGEHTRRVGATAALIAQELALPAAMVSTIRDAAALHDIGKLGISDAILLKRGPLDPDETATMREHVRIGADILGNSQSPVLRLAEEIALCHHERWDGTGYGDGLAREQIPLAARITAIADVFDALTHERPYKLSLSPPKAVNEIAKQAGGQFDPELVDTFVRLDHAALV